MSHLIGTPSYAMIMMRRKNVGHYQVNPADFLVTHGASKIRGSVVSDAWGHFVHLIACPTQR